MQSVRLPDKISIYKSQLCTLLINNICLETTIQFITLKYQ